MINCSHVYDNISSFNCDLAYDDMGSSLHDTGSWNDDMGGRRQLFGAEAGVIDADALCRLKSLQVLALRQNKLQALQSHQPDLIATANVGCQTHLADGTKTPVLHWIELLR